MTPVSNGEWCPLPPTPKERLAAKLIAEETAARARRHGMTRAEFLRTAAATATAFMVLNKVYGLDQWGDAAAMPVKREHCDDLDAARELLDRKMFVMDVQMHHIDVSSPAAMTNCGILRFNSALQRFAELGYDVSMSNLGCPEVLGQMNFIKEAFIDSQTSLGVLSGLPFSGLVIGPKAMADTRDLVNQLAGSERALSQAMIEPAAPGGPTALRTFEQQVREFRASALKVYTYSGGNGTGFFLDDEAVSYPMLAEAQRLGIPLINCHKGLPGFAPNAKEYVRTTDLPKAVRDWPNLKFCAYHSGFYSSAADHPEGKAGLTEFIEVLESMRPSERKRVYAEIGSTFAINLLRGPDQAAHLIGQLLKTLGSRNILWGTDSIWWGSPQFLIDAFKNLRIPASMQEQFGYPPLTEKAKRRILGLNAARLYRVDPRERRCTVAGDQFAQVQAEQGGFRAGRSLKAYGLRTRREFLAFRRLEERIRG
ncbi:MAG TPA: amidohydrolase family protein [Solirubrobacterales bacterium]|nr:amidohydrolase family protein [Solirubrobacterales bacterium]